MANLPTPPETPGQDAPRAFFVALTAMVPLTLAMVLGVEERFGVAGPWLVRGLNALLLLALVVGVVQWLVLELVRRTPLDSSSRLHAVLITFVGALLLVTPTLMGRAQERWREEQGRAMAQAVLQQQQAAIAGAIQGEAMRREAELFAIQQLLAQLAQRRRSGEALSPGDQEQLAAEARTLIGMALERLGPADLSSILTMVEQSRTDSFLRGEALTAIARITGIDRRAELSDSPTTEGLVALRRDVEAWARAQGDGESPSAPQ